MKLGMCWFKIELIQVGQELHFRADMLKKVNLLLMQSYAKCLRRPVCIFLAQSCVELSNGRQKTVVVMLFYVTRPGIMREIWLHLMKEK